MSSNEDYFDAVRGLIARLEAGGLGAAAVELRSGFGCLNGLTDGWALFLESVDRVREAHGAALAKDDRAALEEIRRVAWRLVHR